MHRIQTRLQLLLGSAGKWDSIEQAGALERLAGVVRAAHLIVCALGSE